MALDHVEPPKSERVAKTRSRKAPRSDEAPAALPAAPTQHEAELLRHYSMLVRQIAGSFQRRLPPNVLRDDLIAAGMSGLWDAIRKHGDEQTGNFDWYVRVRIRGAILDELRAQDWLPRRARAAAAEAAKNTSGVAVGVPVVLRFEDVSDSEQARCLIAGETLSDRALEQRAVHESLARAVERLPERERHIVSLHYFKGVKFKELGRMLGVSEPRISQLHSRAMGRLRVLLQEAA
jgi:RNA polymerase sigma factor FliA